MTKRHIVEEMGEFQGYLKCCCHGFNLQFSFASRKQVTSSAIFLTLSRSSLGSLSVSTGKKNWYFFLISFQCPKIFNIIKFKTKVFILKLNFYSQRETLIQICVCIKAPIDGSSISQMFYNVLILKYFAKFTGNTSQKLKFSITDFFRKCDQFDSFFW